MENGNKPINQTVAAKINGHEFTEYSVGGDGIYLPGLTKREYFAAMAMQGLLASGKYAEGIAYNQAISDLSIKIADSLLDEL